MNTQPHIAEREGFLYVAVPYVWGDEPMQETCYFPIGNGYGEKVKTNSYAREELIGQTLRQCNTSGVYELYRPNTMSTVRLYLLQGGKTKAEYIDKTPIVCPKVRRGIETRFRSGRWEKYLKTQGWTSFSD